MAHIDSKYTSITALDAEASSRATALMMGEEYRKRVMPLSYRKRVFSITRDIHEVQQQLRYTTYYGSATKPYEDRHTVPPGFARECMLEFVKYGDHRANWFIENGIAVSVETCIDPASYQYRADFIAHMTPEEVDAWEKFEFINKLSGT